MEALVYTKAYKLQWIYEKIFLIKKRNFLPSNFRFLFEEPLPFANRSNTVADGVLNPFFLISVENFKYGELHLLSKLLQVGIITWNLHTFTCHLDTSLQLRSIFYTNSLKRNFGKDNLIKAKLAKGMGHIYYGEPAWPNDLLYIFPVVILGTIACNVGLASGTSFPYFKYSNVNKFQNPFLALWLGIGATLPIDKSLTLGLFLLLPSESSLDT
ncbi:hypothetical protein ACJX0J_002685 [Zea mays]